MTDIIPANLLVQTAACDEQLQKLQIRAFAPGGHDLTGEVILAVREVVAMVETLEKSRTIIPAAPQVAGSGDSARYPVEILRNIRDWMDGPAFEYAVCPLPVSLATEVRTCVALMEAPTPPAPCATDGDAARSAELWALARRVAAGKDADTPYVCTHYDIALMQACGSALDRPAPDACPHLHLDGAPAWKCKECGTLTPMETEPSPALAAALAETKAVES